MRKEEFRFQDKTHRNVSIYINLFSYNNIKCKNKRKTNFYIIKN